MSLTITNHDDILMINITDDANTVDDVCTIVFVSMADVTRVFLLLLQAYASYMAPNAINTDDDTNNISTDWW